MSEGTIASKTIEGGSVMTGAEGLRALLAAGAVTHVPGVYDPVTAALAVAAGHRAVHLSGAAVSALMLGRSDLGFVHATQIADRAATLAPALNGIPLIADTDTGYGDPLHAVWTGHAYVRAGISGLHVEDRAQPRRTGNLAGKELVDVRTATAKVAALAREVPELVVIARTDAYSVTGLDDAIARCRAYADAGADAVFAEGVDTRDDLTRVHQALPGVPIVISRSEAAGNRPTLSDDELAKAGVRLVLHPVAALLAALRAASQVYRRIADTGSAEPVDRLPWAAFTALIGQQEALELDARYARTAPPGYPSPAGSSPARSSDARFADARAADAGSADADAGPAGYSAPAQTPGHIHTQPAGDAARRRREADIRRLGRLQT
jgi:2-methylisocitrate lyase-like PEP mutase family enzyme